MSRILRRVACVVALAATGCAVDPTIIVATDTSTSVDLPAGGPTEQQVVLPILSEADGARRVDLADPDLCRWASQATDGDTARFGGNADGDTIIVASPPLGIALADEGIEHGAGLPALIANLCHPQGDPERYGSPLGRAPDHPHATAFP